MPKNLGKGFVFYLSFIRKIYITFKNEPDFYLTDRVNDCEKRTSCRLAGFITGSVKGVMILLLSEKIKKTANN